MSETTLILIALAMLIAGFVIGYLLSQFKNSSQTSVIKEENAKLKVLLDIFDNMPLNTDIIITGRSASKKLISRADLVTEMKEIKHPYSKGIIARKGIEY